MMTTTPTNTERPAGGDGSDVAADAADAAIARRLSPGLASLVAQNFFTHSAHVPLTVLILEALLSGGASLTEADSYFLLLGPLVQAFYVGWHLSHGRQRPWRGNLIGPLIYSLVEAALEGPAFFLQAQHWMYWLYSLAFALLQSGQRPPVSGRRPGLSAASVVLESLLRASIPLVMYALVEVRGGKPAAVFFDDDAHQFLAIVLALLGLLLGFAELSARNAQAALRLLAERLGRYSRWSLGAAILDRAMGDESTLALSRQQRVVLFMDIRGFTAWSEAQTPEAVVGLLNDYYAAAEAVLLAAGAPPPVKIKYTADEVMAVFADAASAVAAARALLQALPRQLAAHGLAVGLGAYGGPVVEGVLGSQAARAYDFIGDTVNTAQRLCDAAAPGQLVLAAALREAALPGTGMAGVAAEVRVKGKAQALPVWVESLPQQAA